MTTSLSSTTTTSASGRRLDLGSTLTLRVSAIAFAAAYVVAMFLPTLPEGAYSDARVLALLEDPADRTRIIVGGYALVASAIFLLVFTASLAVRIGREVRPTGLGLALPSAGVYAAILAAAAALFSSIPMGVALGELEAGTDPYVYRVLSNTGFHLMLVGGLGVASVLVASVSIALRRVESAPRWLPVTGFVVAPLLWLGFAWVPQFLLPLWAIAVAAGLDGRLGATHPEH